MGDNQRRTGERRQSGFALNLDEVLSTQPELGPSIPDGGFGWIVFVTTLFFQFLVPCLLVNFGIFLAFTKLENGTSDDKNVKLWDENLLYVPLFYCISRIFFDSSARTLTSTTRTSRLIAVVGTCLVCAGLLFMWMGMTGKHDYWLFAPAGLLAGMGSTIVLTQCETIVSQYFRLKLPILNQISQYVKILGFLVGPIILGHHILSTSLTHVLVWYQAIILQGLILSLAFKKPAYLKSKQRTKPYQFVLSSPDDEEDILSKNARELQIKRQTSTETHVAKIAIDQPRPSTSTNITSNEEVYHENDEIQSKTWVTFDNQKEEEEEDTKYEKLNDWEVFDDDEEQIEQKKYNWERFENDKESSPPIVNNLSLAEETNAQNHKKPSPLFADFPINNNDTYSYDDEIISERPKANVFESISTNNENLKRHLDILKEPTFYKSLLMMIANTYSSFVFFTLFPSYLYIQADFVNIRHMTELVGLLSIVNLFFFSVAFWINIDHKKRPICFWVFYWIGSIGYFMVADFTHEYLLLIGGGQIFLSTVSLEHIGKPLLRVPARGGSSNENFLLCVLSSLSLLLFLALDVSFKACFRFMAVLHFFTGCLWLGNFAYKKFRIR